MSSSSNRSPPTSKRLKTSVPVNTPTHPLAQQAPTFAPPGSFETGPMVPAPAPPPPNPRKRRGSLQTAPLAAMAPPPLTGPVEGEGNAAAITATPDSGGKKKGRTNTPWTAEEEQR